MGANNKKSITLIIVLGITLIVAILALTALSLMTQESRLAEGKIKRIRTWYALQAGMVNATDNLRRTNTLSGSVAVGSGVFGYPPGGIGVGLNRNIANGISSSDIVTLNANY